MTQPTSSVTPYASAADMMARYDKRALCQLCSDDGAPVTVVSLPDNARMAAVLMDASGEVEANCIVGGRYQITPTTNDLAVLTGASKSFLKRLVCDLTMGMLWLARPDREGEAPKSYERALETLVSLSQGKLIFGTAEGQAAGVVNDVVETVDEFDARGTPDVVAGRYFGIRTRQIPPPYGRGNGRTWNY